jgi:hypothetical protein
MEKNILEEVNRMMFYMKYTPGKVISEQKASKFLFEQDEKEYIDWTENGSKTWETASIKNIIEYIKQRDSDSQFANSPIYLAMLQWFLNSDNEETRKSLKNWVGSNLTYGISKSLESNVSDVMARSGLKGVDKTKSLSSTSDNKPQEKGANQDLINKQKDAINILNKVKTKLSSINNQTYNDIKKQVDRLLLELNEFNNKKVYMSIETSQDIIDNMNHILMAFGSGNSYNISYESNALGAVDLKEMLSNLTSIDLRGESETAVVDLVDEQTLPYKSSIIAELTTQAANQLQNKTFLDGFFRGVNPTMSDMIIKAKNITIETQDIEVLSKYKEEKNKSDETGFELIDKSYQWPPNNVSNEERNELSKNFFEDDDVTITEETKSQLQKQVSDAVAEYKRIMTASNNKATPKGLYLSFYSSTSKVRTAYNSKGGEYSETNNVPLSKDRIEAMKTYLNELIDNSELSDFNKVTILELSDPNVGPGWNKLDSVYMDGSPMPFNVAYKNAPLFAQANKRYKGKLTPRQFYGARDINAQKNASKYLGKEVSITALISEYENLYSSFRHASCGFNLIMQAPKGVDNKKDMDFIVSTSGGLGVIIYWTSWDWDIDIDINTKKFKNNARVFFLKLGRKIFNGKSPKPVRKINCPIF